MASRTQLCMYVCVWCMNVCMCLLVSLPCRCMCEGLEGVSDAGMLVFETTSVHNPEVTILALRLASTLSQFCLLPPVLKPQVCGHKLRFYMGSGDPNLGPQACAELYPLSQLPSLLIQS